jgi:MFS family permease
MKLDNIQTGSTSAPYTLGEGASLDKFSGWRILAVLWLLFLNFSLVVYGGSILNAYMATDLQMPRDSFGGGVSAAYLLMGLTAPLTAVLVNRIKPRLTLTIGMLLFAVSTLILGTAVKDALSFTIAYGIVAGVALSLGGLLPLQTVVANWFVRRRALATAVLLSSGGFGGLLASYLFSFLIEDLGFAWQQVWLLIAAFSMLLSVLTFLLVRNHPDDVGQVPDGRLKFIQADKPGVTPRRKVHQTEEEWTFKEVMRTPVVWLILLGSAGMAISFEFCSAYSVIHLMDIGFPNVIASVSIGILALFAIVGRLLTGYLGDRVELHWVMMVGSILIGIGCLLAISPVSGTMINLYALMAGLGQGLVFVALFAIMPNYFGAKVISSILAVFMPIISLATSAVIYLGGVIRMNTGSYVTGFILCAVIAFIAAAASFTARPPLRK